jgi:hypothetical protein
MAIFTAEDHAFFADEGYVVAHNIIPKADCDAVIDAIWEFLGQDRNDPEDWYHLPLKPGGMIEMYQHQAEWNNRQNPRLYEAFTEMLGTEKLCVTIDRVGMKLPYNPAHPDYDHKGFTHWDVDTAKLPVPFGVQGVLCLTDTTADMGGFQCIPGFHKNLEAWIATQPPDRDTRRPDLTGLTVVPIPAQAGDLIIWNNILAHGNGRNLSNRPRYSQYISMFRAERLTEEQREHRIRCWRKHLPPGNQVFPGDPRHIEEETFPTAELTPLGRKLLGLDPWQ